MTEKEKYKVFCEKQMDIPIFSQYWWLDIVCGEDNWDVKLFEKGGHIMASMPYYTKKAAIFNIITIPRLTQTMGIYFKYSKGQKYYKRLSFEKEAINSLLDKLPKYDYFLQKMPYTFTNWQPFYWKNFKQTTVYTYILDYNTSYEEIEKGLENDIRRRKKKAIENNVRIIESDDIEVFYNLNKLTFDRQNIDIPYSYSLVKNLYEGAKSKKSVKLILAYVDDKPISGGFFIYDKNSVYYLMGGVDPSYKDLGGMDLILLEVIKFAIESKRVFDFEGSMVESIEKYFRSFGAVQKPLLQITKINSKILKIREFVKNW